MSVNVFIGSLDGNSDAHESGGYKRTGILTFVLRVRQFQKPFV